MSERKIVVLGGGASGFFAAIAYAERSCPGASITLFEKSPQFLSKVRISGGGRCNVTHSCFEPRDLSSHYPRGGPALLAPFQVFQPRDTIEWFESRGVTLKTEPDGRIFPMANTSQIIIDCLLGTARAARVELIANRAPETVTRRAEGGFDLRFASGGTSRCDRLSCWPRAGVAPPPTGNWPFRSATRGTSRPVAVHFPISRRPGSASWRESPSRMSRCL